MPENKRPRVIKRYANRKLYDMLESCYITHDEIAALVENGDEVKIIDNRTKEDLTTRTLTQILFEKEKKERKTLPLATLQSLFETGGDFFQRHIAQPVTNLRDEAEETVRKVFRTRQEEEEETIQVTLPPMDDHSDINEKQRPTDAFRDWFENSQLAFENLQNTFEKRWNLVMNSLRELDANHSRVRELENRVAELETRLTALEED
jgi:polyhydroxyalkanoate synthesis repressor PhaR